MTNTEKPTTKQEAKKQGATSIPSQIKKEVAPIKKTETKPKKETLEIATEEKLKEEPKKIVQKKSLIKKSQTSVHGKSLHVSTKYAIAICKFIKHKPIEKAISELENVPSKRQAIPMKGEIPHRKGRGISSGRFPKRASIIFVTLLKSLASNASLNNLEEPIIIEAIANMASRPYGRFGSIKRKRTHVKIVARDKAKLKELKRKSKKKK